MAYQVKEYTECPTCGRRVPIVATKGAGKIRLHKTDAGVLCPEGREGKSS